MLPQPPYPPLFMGFRISDFLFSPQSIATLTITKKIPIHYKKNKYLFTNLPLPISLSHFNYAHLMGANPGLFSN